MLFTSLLEEHFPTIRGNPRIRELNPETLSCQVSFQDTDHLYYIVKLREVLIKIKTVNLFSCRGT